jgi:hypothetical protein
MSVPCRVVVKGKNELHITFSSTLLDPSFEFILMFYLSVIVTLLEKPE